MFLSTSDQKLNKTIVMQDDCGKSFDFEKVIGAACEQMLDSKTGITKILVNNS